MKRLVLFMMAVMLLSITVNAQKKGGKTLVAVSYTHLVRFDLFHIVRY